MSCITGTNDNNDNNNGNNHSSTVKFFILEMLNFAAARFANAPRAEF